MQVWVTVNYQRIKYYLGSVIIVSICILQFILFLKIVDYTTSRIFYVFSRILMLNLGQIRVRSKQQSAALEPSAGARNKRKPVKIRKNKRYVVESTRSFFCCHVKCDWCFFCAIYEPNRTHSMFKSVTKYLRVQ